MNVIVELPQTQSVQQELNPRPAPSRRLSGKYLTFRYILNVPHDGVNATPPGPPRLAVRMEGRRWQHICRWGLSALVKYEHRCECAGGGQDPGRDQGSQMEPGQKIAPSHQRAQESNP